MPRRNASPDAGLLRRARDLHVGDRGARDDTHPVHGHVVEAAPEPHHHTRDTTVAHDQIRAEADDGHRNVGGKRAEKIGEIILILGHEQHLRRTTDAEPG